MGKPLKPDLDEPTLRIMERMVNTPPKPHEEMKLGKKRRQGKPSRIEPKKKRDRTS
jgi:hypothetical protein